jgi:Pentapeptide repeats (8 copies)
MASLNQASLNKAHLRSADLSEASLVRSYLMNAGLRSANLQEADLPASVLIEANLCGVNLTNTNLTGANLVNTNLSNAMLRNCAIYGISAWDVKLEGAIQENLIITSEPKITVDNLKVAQFICLLLNNKEIREVIDTITSKVVLILGRFTPERKAILDALREELRKRNYSPILFDFEKPASRDLAETVSTLAHMTRFVIADITDAKSIPQELMTIVPNLPSVPVQPLILNSQHEYGMFEHFSRYPWVLPVYQYINQASLLQSLKENVIDPAEQKAQELTVH